MTTVVLEHFKSTDVILITPHTVVPNKNFSHHDDQTMYEYGRKLFDAANEIRSKRQERSEEGKVGVLDMHAAFVEAAKVTPGGLPTLLNDDGLHINQAGYKVSKEERLLYMGNLLM